LAFRTKEMDWVDAVATANTPATLADMSCRPHFTDWAEER